MPKTVPPGTITSAGQKFRVNVVPDVFDERDLLYRPRLLPLPPSLDARPDTRYVMTQVGNSCTGHALACMINTVLGGGPARSHARGRARPARVSPYMLYRMARRYDEFQGDEDEGSSLRGALKGWYYQGVLPLADWPRLDMDPEPDVDHDEKLFQLAMQHPLGAFYRVNPFRLDDVQSAVAELSCIVASALVHSGWEQPAKVQHRGGTLHVIERPDDVTPLGGHAFGVVGYNDVGLLIQNSWGEGWGAKGFATLPYGDWLASVYDAWVARPGVPMVAPERSRSQLVTTTTGVVAGGPGPDLQRLAGHVVNLGAGGRLSATGRFVSTPRQLEVLFDRMTRCHEQWRDMAAKQGEAPPPRRVVLYAPGGVDSERDGLDVAQEQLGWWLNNAVYPVTFAWQTDVLGALLDRLTDLVRGKVPFDVLGFDLVEQADRLVERFARDHLAWMWDAMKQNASAASAPVEGGVDRPADDAEPSRGLAALPGASLFVDRLRRYVASLSEGERVEVHLAGHSAGCVFLAALLPRLVERGIGVETMTWLAPAVAVDDFAVLVLPQLRSGQVRHFASFGLNDQQELDDVCGTKGLAVYQKSLLYLVSRGLERGRAGGRGAEVPLLGMKRSLGAVLDGSSVAETLPAVGAEQVWSPSEHPASSRCAATSHRGFDEDAATMTALLLRILGQTVPSATNEFVRHAPLVRQAPREAADATGPEAAVKQVAATRVADVSPAGDTPVSRMAAPGPAPTDGTGDKA